MAEESTTQDTQEPGTQDTPATENTESQPDSAASSAETENTETPAEHMIPKSRFDAVNSELKTIKAELQKAAKEREDAERVSAEEQGKYKELYEKAAAKAAKAEADAKAAELQLLRQQVAAKVSLPAVMVDRLQGETIEDIEADAKAIMAALPKPNAPNINGESGDGAAPTNSNSWWAEMGISKEEAAARMGVNPNYLE